MSTKFSTNGHFEKDFAYIDPDVGELFNSPFPVWVAGLGGEKLGVGHVIGVFTEGIDEVPVIAVDDDNGEVVEMLGDECIWGPGIPPAVLDDIIYSIKSRKIMRASKYLEQVNRNY